MSTQVATDIHVPRFGYIGDEHAKRFVFPRAELSRIEGRSGSIEYGAAEGLFDNLEGRLGTVRWTTDAASLGHGWLNDDAGRFRMEVDRIEMPKGVMLTRAESGVELVAPHVSLSEMRLTVRGPFGRTTEEPAPEAPATNDEPPPLRQDKLRFLDSLSGRIFLTVKVVLDLPVSSAARSTRC